MLDLGHERLDPIALLYAGRGGQGRRPDHQGLLGERGQVRPGQLSHLDGRPAAALGPVPALGENVWFNDPQAGDHQSSRLGVDPHGVVRLANHSGRSRQLSILIRVLIKVRHRRNRRWRRLLCGGLAIGADRRQEQH